MTNITWYSMSIEKELEELRKAYREIENKTKWSRFTIGKVLKDDYDKQLK